MYTYTTARAAERIGGSPGQINTKSGAHKMDCVRGSGGTSPGNVEILHARGLVEFINFENDRKCGLLAFFGSSFV